MKQAKKKTGISFLAQALFIACLLLTLTACGKKDAKETEAPTTPAATQETQGATQAPSEAETVPAPTTEAGSAETAGSGMGSEKLTAARDAVAEAYGENYLPEMPLDAEMLEAIYGVAPDMYDEALGEVPMISAQVDTLILIKAKEGRAADVQAALEAYRTYQLEEGMNYPMNVPKIEASEVLVYGDYVCYLMLGTIDMDIEDEAEMLTAYQEQNQIGKEVLEQQFAE